MENKNSRYQSTFQPHQNYRNELKEYNIIIQILITLPTLAFKSSSRTCRTSPSLLSGALECKTHKVSVYSTGRRYSRAAKCCPTWTYSTLQDTFQILNIKEKTFYHQLKTINI